MTEINFVNRTMEMDGGLPYHRNSSSSPEGKNSEENGIETEIRHNGVGELSKPKKKRKTTNRACDACAIRKVKCEQNRPCSHCVSNNLNCTQLRERKKSGPKTLHKKTLDSINSFSEKKGPEGTVRPSLSHHSTSSSNTLTTVQELIASNHADHPVESVPQNLTNESVDSMRNQNVLTSERLVNILRLIEDPVMYKCLQNLTVHSLLTSYESSIKFVQVQFANTNGELVIQSTDLMVLSTLLIIFTLNLLIVENLIKFLSVGYKTQFMDGDIDLYKSLKNLLQLKITEVLLPIEQLSFFPGCSTVQQMHISQQLYYNQSISALHLCNFHQITNYLNTQNQNQQKLIYLRKSITFYQLINLPFKSTAELTDVQLYELYESLFTMESLYFFLSSDFIIKSNNVLLNEWNNYNFSHIQFHKKSSDGNSLFEIFKIINKEDLINSKSINYLFKFSIFNTNKNSSIKNIKKINNNKTIGNTSYIQFKQFLNSLSNEDFMFEILKYIILFKIIIVHCNELNFMHLKCELIESVINLNNLLDFKDNNLYLQISNYQLLPHLMQVLKFNIEIDESHLKENQMVLMKFTKNLIELFPFCNKNIKDLISCYDGLRTWFNKLSQLSSEMKQDGNVSEKDQFLLNDILNEFDSKMINSTEATNPNSTFITHCPSPQNLLRDFDLSNANPSNGLDGPAKNTPNAPMTLMTGSSDHIRSTLNSSGSLHLLLNPLQSLPAKPVVTTTAATTGRNEDLSELISLSLSESAKNLCNTFHQFGDEFSHNNDNSNSLSNLFQFNSASRTADWSVGNEEIKSQPNFLL